MMRGAHDYKLAALPKSEATVKHYNNATNGRRAIVKAWPDGCVLLSLYGRGRMLRSTRQPSQSVAREIALNWTRGVCRLIGELA